MQQTGATDNEIRAAINYKEWPMRDRYLHESYYVANNLATQER